VNKSVSLSSAICCLYALDAYACTLLEACSSHEQLFANVTEICYLGACTPHLLSLHYLVKYKYPKTYNIYRWTEGLMELFNINVKIYHSTLLPFADIVRFWIFILCKVM